jgi:hypothetical protein
VTYAAAQLRLRLGMTAFEKTATDIGPDAMLRDELLQNADSWVSDPRKGRLESSVICVSLLMLLGRLSRGA